jgi:hypothetical protein
MSLKEELLAINLDQAETQRITNAVLDKLHHLDEEVDYMFNSAHKDYPAIANIGIDLMKRREVIAGLTNGELNAALFGAAAVFLTIREIAEIQDFKKQISDIT